MVGRATSRSWSSVREERANEHLVDAPMFNELLPRFIQSGADFYPRDRHSGVAIGD